MKAIAFFILTTISIMPSLSSSAQKPERIMIYYMRTDPWGWISDKQYGIEDLIRDFPDCLMVTSRKEIGQLMYRPDSSKIVDNDIIPKKDRYDYWEARFALYMIYPSKVDTLILSNWPSREHLYNQDCFVDEAYYNNVVEFISKKDKKFRKWYRAHYHKGVWHYFDWRFERKIIKNESHKYCYYTVIHPCLSPRSGDKPDFGRFD